MYNQEKKEKNISNIYKTLESPSKTCMWNLLTGHILNFSNTNITHPSVL